MKKKEENSRKHAVLHWQNCGRRSGRTQKNAEGRSGYKGDKNSVRQGRTHRQTHRQTEAHTARFTSCRKRCAKHPHSHSCKQRTVRRRSRAEADQSSARSTQRMKASCVHMKKQRAHSTLRRARVLLRRSDVWGGAFRTTHPHSVQLPTQPGLVL